MKHKLLFDLGDKVKIKEIDLNSVVQEINIAIYGIKYLVRYFYNAEIKTFWAYGNEIEKLR